MPLSFLNFLNLKKTISVFLLAIIFTNMAFMFAMLPIKEEKATCPDAAGEIKIQTALQKIWQELKAAWQAENSAINKKTSTFSGTTALVKLWEKAEKISGKLLRAALLVLLHRILQMITNEIIKWINGGGEPKFVSDWAGFLHDVANEAGGEFLNNLAGGFLCSPFSFQIRIALMPVPYYQQARCTLDKIQANFQAFASSFTAGGGWPMWLQVIQPNNNFYGSYLMALDEKTRKEEEARQKSLNEAMSGGGFLSDKKCTACVVENLLSGTSQRFSGISACEAQKKSAGSSGEASFRCTSEQIMTPASIAQYEIQQAVDSTRKIIQDTISALTANSGILSPYLVSIANALINRVIQTGLGLVAQAISSGDQSYGPTFSSPNAPLIPTEPMFEEQINTTGITSVNDIIASSPALIVAEELLKENTQAKLVEQQESFAIIVSIQGKQTQALQGLKTLIENNCSLPLWATAQTLSDNGTIQIIKITATDIGSITIKKTIATNQLGTSQTIEIQEISPLVAGQKTTLESAIAATQQTLSDIDASIADNRNAMTAANAYQIASERAYNSGQINSLTEVGNELETAYSEAIASSQKAVGTNEDSITLILADAQEKNISVISETTAIENARDGLNSQLSAISSKPTEVQNLITNCSTSP